MKKVFSVVGIIASLLLVLFGFITFGGGFGGNTYYPDSVPYSYDSGYATFGSDYYTYTNNNMAEAADGAQEAAKNLDKIAGLLKNALGACMIGLGLIGVAAFGVVFAGCPKPERVSAPYTPMYPDAIPADNGAAPQETTVPQPETDFGGTVYVPEENTVSAVNAEKIVNESMAAAENFDGTQTVSEQNNIPENGGTDTL